MMPALEGFKLIPQLLREKKKNPSCLSQAESDLVYELVHHLNQTTLGTFDLVKQNIFVFIDFFFSALIPSGCC